MQLRARSIEVTLACCCLGAVIAAGLPGLPGVPIVLCAAGAGLMLTLRSAGRGLGCLLLSFAWFSYFASAEIDRRAQACRSSEDVRVRGSIVGLPQRTEGRLRFDLRLEEPVTGHCAQPLSGIIRMSWYESHATVSTGERWSFTARIRPIHGHVNPGGFDYERWALSRRLRGSGYVKSGERLSGSTRSGVDGLRAALRGEIKAADRQAPGMLLALATGDTSLITSGAWDTFRASGTVHLVVISGLHLGLVAGFGWWIGRLTPLVAVGIARRWPRQWAGFAGALAAATGYGALAGWSLPVWRAWLMVAVSLAWLTAGRRLPLPHLFVLVLSTVLLLDPLALLDTGFWLSFGAVAVLLIGFGPRSGRGRGARIVQWGRDLLSAQLVLFVAMAPVLAMTIGQIAVAAPLANLIAVPVVSVVLVPLVMLATLSSDTMLGFDAAEQVWRLADLIAVALFRWLETVAAQAPVLVTSIAPGALALTVCLTGVVVLLPVNLLWRLLAVAVAASSLLPQAQRVIDGEFRVTGLDVGQGLSVVVDTARHRLVYDAGPRYRSGFDLGARVVAPALRAMAGPHPEVLVISHADSDHAGGEAALRSGIPVRAVLRGSPVADLDGRSCNAGQRWQWDGVRFEILHPAPAPAGAAAVRRLGRPVRRNDQSCVLLISNGSQAALLPGDISERVERRLVEGASVRLSDLDLLLAPHHGSRTSSSKTFVGVSSPALVWFSVGYLNRFGHPDEIVMSRYRGIGSRTYSTAKEGALTWRSARPDQVVGWRQRERRFWR